MLSFHSCEDGNDFMCLRIVLKLLVTAAAPLFALMMMRNDYKFKLEELCTSSYLLPRYLVNKDS